MKKIAIFVAVLVVYSQVSVACEKLEYEEMKDMPKEKLIEKICTYHDLYILDRKAVNDMAALDQKYGVTKDSHTDKVDAESQECLAQMSKMQRVLENIHKEKVPERCLKL